MLDMGFIADIRRVIRLLPKKRQNLLFSATYSDDMRQPGAEPAAKPVEIEVARRNAAVERVEQRSTWSRKDQKRASAVASDSGRRLVAGAGVHAHQARREPTRQTAASRTASRPRRFMATRARTRARARWRTSRAYRIRALVATEVAARGLDIKELPHVVNYELPNVPEDYVHRIGRTGRAGATGIAVSLVSSDESGLLKDVEKLLRKSIPQRRCVPAGLADRGSLRRLARQSRRACSSGRVVSSLPSAAAVAVTARSRSPSSGGGASATARRVRIQSQGRQALARGRGGGGRPVAKVEPVRGEQQLVASSVRSSQVSPYLPAHASRGR